MKPEVLITILNFFVLINSSLSKRSPNCNHLEPFVFKKLFLGIDLIKVNLLPDREDFFSTNGFKDLIFNATCYENYKFVLPNFVIENQNITYYLPDHMKVELYKKVDEVAHRTFEEEEESYRQNMMNSLNVAGLNDEEKKTLQEFGYNISNIDQLFIGAFKLNKQYQRIKKERLANKRIPIESRININGWLIKLDDTKMALTNAFQNEIRNLPSNYEDSKSKYRTLISTFGTHFFTNYIVGGLAKVNFRIMEEASVQLDQLDKDKFNNDKPFDFDLSGVELDVEENFGSNEIFFISDNKLHRRSIYFYGGEIKRGIEQNGHSIQDWKKSVVNDPWLIGGNLVPISRLIKDRQIKKNLLRAMMDYLDKAEILNLKETVSTLEEFDEKDKWLESYKKKVDELNERTFINHSNLVSLSMQFNNEINFQIHKRLIYNNPYSSGIYSSSLDQNKKKESDLKGAANSSSLNFWLSMLILIFYFVIM